MTQSVELGDDLMAEICREAERQGISVLEQVEQWVRLGKAIVKSENFNLAKVEAALSAKVPTAALSPIEFDVWSDMFDDLLTRPTPQAEALFAERRRLGLGSGLDDNGNLVHASNLMARKGQ